MKSGATEKKKKKKTQLGGREFWLTAVHEDRTGNFCARRPKSVPGRKDNLHHWSGSLRRSNEGIAHNHNTFTNLPAESSKNFGYLSTSQYLRNKLGANETSELDDPFNLSNGGHFIPNIPAPRQSHSTPNRHRPEDYFDEIAALKKLVINLRGENEVLRGKIRSVEEDNARKDKILDKHLNPDKNQEIRRLLGDRKVDSMLVVDSIRNKLLATERRLKDREADLLKIQSDIRYTRMEECKIQVDVLNKEIERLRSMSFADLEYNKELVDEHSNKESEKVKGLNKRLRDLSEQNAALTTENKALQEDLAKLSEKQEHTDTLKKEYQDMNRKELLNVITHLEDELDHLQSQKGSTRTEFNSSGRIDTENKLVLTGNFMDKLDQLDKRESELISEIKRLNEIITRLKDDKEHLKEKLESEYVKVEELSNRLKKAGLPHSISGETPRKGKGKRPSSAGSTVSKASTRPVKGKKRSQYGDSDDENYDPTEFIQFGMIGYLNRERFLRQGSRDGRESPALSTGRSSPTSSWSSPRNMRGLSQGIRPTSARNRRFSDSTLNENRGSLTQQERALNIRNDSDNSASSSESEVDLPQTSTDRLPRPSSARSAFSAPPDTEDRRYQRSKSFTESTEESMSTGRRTPDRKSLGSIYSRPGEARFRRRPSRISEADDEDFF